VNEVTKAYLSQLGRDFRTGISRGLKAFFLGYVLTSALMGGFRRMTVLSRILFFGIGYVLVRRWFGIYRLYGRRRRY